MNLKVQLTFSHLLVSKSIIDKVFGDENNILVFYDKKQKIIILAPTSNTWIKKFLKPSHAIMKLKNLHGDKTINIRPLIIDYDFDDNNKELDCRVLEDKKIIHVFLD